MVNITGRAPFTAVLALGAVVAIASNGSPTWTLVRTGPANRWAILLAVAQLCAVGLLMASVLVLVVHRAFFARVGDARRLRTTVLRAVPATTAGLAVSGLLMIATREDLMSGPQRDGSSSVEVILPDGPGSSLGIVDRRSLKLLREGDGVQDDEIGRTGEGPRGGSRRLPAVIGIIALLAFAAATWSQVIGRRRRAARLPEIPDDDPDQSVVHGTVVDTLDAMLADPDPRTAIIGAYARLLEGLEACGSGRRPHEAPLEYLRRILSQLHVRSSPLRRLTALFQLARFSTRPLDSTHRQQALEALRDVATDLERRATPQSVR